MIDNRTMAEQAGSLRRVWWGVSNFEDEERDIEGMDDVHVGIYHRMKLRYMLRKGLPSDINALHQMFARNSAGKKAVVWLVANRFTVDGPHLRHPAWDATIAAAEKLSRKRADAGRKGAESLHGKAMAIATAEPLANAWQIDGIKNKEVNNKEINIEEEITEQIEKNKQPDTSYSEPLHSASSESMNIHSDTPFSAREAEKVEGWRRAKALSGLPEGGAGAADVRLRANAGTLFASHVIPDEVLQEMLREAA